MGGQKQNGLFLPLLIGLCCTVSLVAMAMPSSLWAQGEPTATPDPEGVIYDEVRPNDSLWAVAIRAGITLPELLEFNGLSESDIIQPGQLLIVGYGTPAPTATVDLPVMPTGTRSPPTPTATAAPAPQTGICLTAFTDTNGDGQRDAGEPLRAAVAFTVFNEEAVVANYVTDGISEPFCLEGLAAGNYEVTRSIGSDETLTGAGDRGVILTEGNVLYLESGSYTGPAPTLAATGGSEATGAALRPDPATQVAPALVDTPAQSGQRHSGSLRVASIIVASLLLAGLFLLLARSRQFRSSNHSDF